MSTRVVLVGRNPMMRAALREYLTHGGEGIVIVGEATDVDQAVDQLTLSSPDAVVLDLDTSETSGHHNVHRLRTSCPGTRIIYVSEKETIQSKYDEDGCEIVHKSKLAVSILDVLERNSSRPDGNPEN